LEHAKRPKIAEIRAPELAERLNNTLAAAGQALDNKPAEIVADPVPALQKVRPLFYHLSEGTDTDASQRLLDLQYSPNTWGINRNLITIHCTALAADHFQQLKAAAGTASSPLSNLLLYGETADVAAAKATGVAIALGSDWSPSGSKNLLGELKTARLVSCTAWQPLQR
jgi:hypothetical protein